MTTHIYEFPILASRKEDDPEPAQVGSYRIEIPGPDEIPPRLLEELQEMVSGFCRDNPIHFADISLYFTAGKGEKVYVTDATDV